MSVYYLSYGSNMNEARMMKYIVGGTHKGSTAIHPGCKDPSPPTHAQHLVVHGWRLVFAYQSRSWGGAVCGILEDERSSIHAVIYRITQQQFIDVVAQENGMETLEFDLAFETMRTGDRSEMLAGPYGCIVCLGEHQGTKMYSFTHNTEFNTSVDQRTHTPPARAYLHTIYSGLRSHGLDSQHIIDYLLSVHGVAGFLKEEQLVKYLRDY